MKGLFKILLPALMLVLGWSASAQQKQYVIRGRVTDAASGEPIARAAVFLKSPRVGVRTDFEGFYIIRTEKLSDTIICQYVGYKARRKALGTAQEQVINFQLEQDIKGMVVEVRPGENPAWRILRGVWAQKPRNDRSRLEAYQYESYSKVEMDADNITDQFRKSRAMRPFRSVFDSLKLAAGEDGKPILPFFISETISDYYYLKSPERKTEHIKASKLTGVGLDDGSLASQLVGTSLQDYNFYQNWISILEKNFASPISEGGLSWYRYYLNDSAIEDGRKVYKIDFIPRNPKDLVFTGHMWIEDSTFGLKRIYAEIGKGANLNYIEKLRIQQELVPTPEGPWMIAKARILVDIAEISESSFGILAKLYVSNRNFKLNQPRELSFYSDRIRQSPDALDKDESFWDTNRHDSLTAEDRSAMRMVDTIRNLPKVKSAISVVDFILDGHIKVGPVEFGPHILIYGNNVIEGSRFRMGIRTNEKFSRTWIFRGYAAIGTRDLQDHGVKFGVQVERFISRKNWTKVGAQYRYDIEGIGINDDFFSNNNLLTASSQIGLLRRLNLVHQMRLWTESDIFRGFNLRLFALRKIYDPQVHETFQFAYIPDPEDNILQQKMTTMQLTAEGRYAIKETWVIHGNNRKHIGLDKAPILTGAVTIGFGGNAPTNNQFVKYNLGISQKVRMGFLGRGHYHLMYSEVYGRVPYPLLNILPGNETLIRTENTFNLMRFFEFVTDRSITLFYTQHLDGLLLNRVPLIKHLKWREVVGARLGWGWLRAENRLNSSLYPEPSVYPVTPFRTLDPNIPYIEVNYGVENVFRFFRIDVIQRLNYHGFGASTFAVKMGLYFSF